MTLRLCYRATCDAPDCTTTVMLGHERAKACRDQLVELGWTARLLRTWTSGAPRILYACPAHREWQPAPPSGPRCLCTHTLDEHQSDGCCRAAACVCCLFVNASPRPPALTNDRDRRRAMLWLLHQSDQDHQGASYHALAAAVGLSRTRVHEIVNSYEHTLAGRMNEATAWREPWADRLRAAGAIR